MFGRYYQFTLGATLVGMLSLLPMGCPVPPVPDPDNPAGVTLSRDVAPVYVPGESLAVTCTIDAAQGDNISAIGLFETLPEGWEFVSASGPPILPASGDTDRLDFAWISPPTLPYEFTYHVMAPLDARGDALFMGTVEYREGAGPYQIPNVTSTVASANTAGLVLDRRHASTFGAGETFTVVVEIGLESDATITAMGLSETIPDGWSLESVTAENGGLPDVAPDIGAGGLLEYVWITIPTFPYTFSYTLSVPDEAAGTAQFSGQISYRETGGPLSTGTITTTADGPAT